MPSSLYALKIASEKVEMIEDILTSLDRIIEVVGFISEDDKRKFLELYAFLDDIKYISADRKNINKISENIEKIINLEANAQKVDEKLSEILNFTKLKLGAFIISDGELKVTYSNTLKSPPCLNADGELIIKF